MNAMPKVVVSATLTDPAWNNTTIISGSLAEEVARLKRRYDGDILVAGSATLVRSLAEHNLVDEYRLMVHPVVLGAGKRLFPDGFPMTGLQLAESRTVGPDVLLLTYRPATSTADHPDSS
jgi:dihydrofolate reductase